METAPGKGSFVANGEGKAHGEMSFGDICPNIIEIHQSALIDSKGHERCSPECLFTMGMMEWLSREYSGF